MLAIWLTVMYDTVVIEGSMPSLTLHLGGKDRSVINCHFPGLDRLGITPIRLSCMFGIDPIGRGPSILPFATSVAR